MKTITFATITDQRWCRIKPGRKDGEFIAVIVEGKDEGKVVLPRLDYVGFEHSHGEQNVFALVEINEERDRYCFGHPAAAHYRYADEHISHVEQGQKLPLFPAETLAEAKVEFERLVQQELDKKRAEHAEYFAELERYRAAKAAAEAEAAATGPGGKELFQMLRNHDWHYDFSDDGRVWRAGKDAWERIVAHIKTMDVAVARAVWEQVAPDGFEFPLSRTKVFR